MARSVYVIRLDDKIWEEDQRFREANPHYRVAAGKGCVYVGQTGIDIDERFRQHKRGYKCAHRVRKHGLYVMRRKCLVDVSDSSDEACELEARHAEDLRKKGWAVWSN